MTRKYTRISVIIPSQACLKVVKRRGGRILIYVWAVEQDEESKRIVPKESQEQINTSTDSNVPSSGVDVLVPWVHNEAKLAPDSNSPSSSNTGPRIYKRYYHMFAEGELRALVIQAAQNLHLVVGDPSQYDCSQPKTGQYLNGGQTQDGKESDPVARTVQGIHVVQEGWERSNYYVELLLWEKPDNL